MQIIGKLALFALLVAPTSAVSAPDKFTVDRKNNVQRFYGVPIDLALAGLKSLPCRVKTGQEFGEGDAYPVAWIQAKDGIAVKASFGLDGKLYYVETSDPRAVGPKGIKVGSLLVDVKAAWPTGRFLYGSEDGRFVTFITDSNIIYVFDPDDLPPQAFDYSDAKIDVPNARVKTLRIFARLEP